jgi:uncharacterized membrane protein YqjE
MLGEIPPKEAGLLANARALAGSAASLLGARARLAALELGEARDALLQVMLLGAAGVLAAGFALLFLSGLIIVLSWDALGWRVLLLLFFAYALLAALLLQAARKLLMSGVVGLPTTLDELQKDRDSLFPETKE